MRALFAIIGAASLVSPLAAAQSPQGSDEPAAATAGPYVLADAQGANEVTLVLIDEPARSYRSPPSYGAMTPAGADEATGVEEAAYRASARRPALALQASGAELTAIR